MTTVAVLGTGTMGTGMARRIAGAGLDLRVWNRSPEPAQARACPDGCSWLSESSAKLPWRRPLSP